MKRFLRSWLRVLGMMAGVLLWAGLVIVPMLALAQSTIAFGWAFAAALVWVLIVISATVAFMDWWDYR